MCILIALNSLCHWVGFPEQMGYSSPNLHKSSCLKVVLQIFHLSQAYVIFSVYLHFNPHWWTCNRIAMMKEPCSLCRTWISRKLVHIFARETTLCTFEIGRSPNYALTLPLNSSPMHQSPTSINSSLCILEISPKALPSTPGFSMLLRHSISALLPYLVT